MDNIDHVAEIMKGHKDDMVVKISDTEIKDHDACPKTMNLSQFNHLTCGSHLIQLPTPVQKKC